ncbi:MAG: hypothetical protein PHE27_04740 [Alphaproteobacteria bacterium]|nr:hypothetical protein [Alphaproteobacteria bacterium]
MDLISNKVALTSAGGLALLGLAAFARISIANAGLKADLAEAQARSHACLLANAEFETRIEKQNAAVEKMKALGEARGRRAAEAARTAKDEVQKYLAAAETLRAAKVGGDACAAAAALFDAYLKETGK